MPRGNKPHLRCAGCRLHVGLCLCAELPRLVTRTRVIVVVHRAEDRKSTNTGTVAARCLADAEVVLRGDANRPSAPLEPSPGARLGVLFPCEGALSLGDDDARRALWTLVVPDGTWGQAAKARRRVPGLERATPLALPPGPPSRYRLRAATDAARLSTFEAIARALGLLEGEGVERALMDVFDRLIDRALFARGDKRASEVRGGVPESAAPHDPWSGLATSGGSSRRTC